jgi:hypothetical protein
MTHLAGEAYAVLAARSFGNDGVAALKVLLHAIRRVYQHIPPDVRTSPLVIFRRIPGYSPQLPSSVAIRMLDWSALAFEMSALVIEVVSPDEISVWKDCRVNAQTLSADAIVYVYDGSGEAFYAKGEVGAIPVVFPGCASIFAIPTFRVLRHALERYKTSAVRKCSCPVLCDAWHDPARIFFTSGPEKSMRQSLTWFLKNVMGGDVEVRPEQIVDESHPVDIKVTWQFSSRHALVEIKWLGKSKGADGSITAEHHDARAKAGAKQLADYIDMNYVQAPGHSARGYLVLIDGRRARTNHTTTAISKEDGFAFEHREIEYDPKYHESRSDFDVPIRMFAEPVCQ